MCDAFGVIDDAAPIAWHTDCVHHACTVNQPCENSSIHILIGGWKKPIGLVSIWKPLLLFCLEALETSLPSQMHHLRGDRLGHCAWR